MRECAHIVQRGSCDTHRVLDLQDLQEPRAVPDPVLQRAEGVHRWHNRAHRTAPHAFTPVGGRAKLLHRVQALHRDGLPALVHQGDEATGQWLSSSPTPAWRI